MAIFSPVRTPNAIDQCVFVVKLSHKIGETHLEALRQLEQALGEFINFHEVKLQGIVLSPDGANTQESRTIGVECHTTVHPQEHLINNERSDWIIRIVEESIQINCLNYTSWAESIEYVDNLLAKVFKCLPTDEIIISSIHFQVNDSFVVQDSIEKIDFSQLFNQSKYLPENVWDAGSLWHVNSGWFDDPENNKALNVLNISVRKDVTEKVKLMVLIEHLQQITLDPMIIVKNDKDAPITIFNHLHDKNKSVVKELLTSDIKNKIGLS